MILTHQKKLLRHMRTKLAQFRVNKSSLLRSYLHTVATLDADIHDTDNLFNCNQVPRQCH